MRLEPAIVQLLTLLYFLGFAGQGYLSWSVWGVVELVLILYWTTLETPTPRPSGLPAVAFGLQHIVLAGSSGVVLWLFTDVVGLG